MVARERSIVLPGNYDGVHRGHRSLIARARDMAKPTEAVVPIFFDPHPMEVLLPERAPARLTSAARRQELLKDAGADRVHVQRFDEALSKMSPEAFVEQVLVKELRASKVICGADFRFGRKRAGDVATLRALGQEHDFETLVGTAIKEGDEVVSSTRIRRALGDGRVGDAARLLTRYHDVDGVVVKGQQRGRTIGFPTANLGSVEGMLPKDGVYALSVRLPDGRRLGGVGNLGVRPTVGAGRSVEAHIFDYEGDLYDKSLRVSFVSRIRDERRFDGLEALVRQIELDAEEARELLTEMNTEWL